jgi:hypothetical protein
VTIWLANPNALLPQKEFTMTREVFEPIKDAQLDTLERLAHDARAQNAFRRGPADAMLLEWARERLQLVAVDPDVVLTLVDEVRMLRDELDIDEDGDDDEDEDEEA